MTHVIHFAMAAASLVLEWRLIGSARTSGLVACLVGGVLASSVAADQGASGETSSSVMHRIDAITAKYSGLGADELDESLMEDEQMKFIVHNPKRFRRAIDEYLHLFPGLSEAKARTVILGLQCLPMTDYLAFVNRLSSAPQGAISPLGAVLQHRPRRRVEHATADELCGPGCSTDTESRCGFTERV